MRTDGFLPRPGWSGSLGLAAVVLLFCVPLFFGLDGWDQRNDEAIYSYAVDRVLETGDWLTPRSIPSDAPFLEKPPLKIWLVAGGMWLGLIPVDDAGMRVLDAVFGSLAFLYVYLLGRRLAGPLAGAVSVFLLFEFEPLIFNHGIRGNQMEAALLLAYSGGMYHFARWADGDVISRRRHAIGVAACFVLAFMTKFVAAAFLPIVCAAAMATRPRPWIEWRARAREWVGPLAFAAAAIVPWFLYQAIHSGKALWDVMVGEHVYARFMGTLAASHLQPWHHYFTHTWLELGFSESRVIFLLGLVALGLRAWQRRDWLAQVLLIWWIVPFGLMSLGTSKLFYYAYPFLVPLAIGAGLASVQIVELIANRMGPALIAKVGRKRVELAGNTPWLASSRVRALAIGGALCAALALWTFVAGSVTWEIGGTRLFRNSSVVRPAALAAVLWYFAGLSRLLLRLTGVSVLLLCLPISLYLPRVERLRSVDHPLRTARDCALSVKASGAQVGAGVFDASGDLHHAYYYYLRRLGPWLWPEDARPGEIPRRLESAGGQTLVILSAEDYVRLGGGLVPVPSRAPSPSAVGPPGSIRLERGLPPGIAIGDTVVILFPGPFEVCSGAAALAGARALEPLRTPVAR